MTIEPSESEVRKQAETVATTVARIPRDFREQWELFTNLDTDEVVRQVTEDFQNAPGPRRDALIAFLAKRLGYSRFSTKARLTSRPLWDVLDPTIFKSLDHHDRKVLSMIAQTTPNVAYYLHPKAALAAIALWRNGSSDEREAAQRWIQTYGLPTTSEWLYSICVELLALDAAENRSSLLDLARGQLDSERYDAAALIAGIALVAQLDPWRVGSIRSNLIVAADRAATEFPFTYRTWIDLLADCAITGSLHTSWIERPFRAAIRMANGDPKREQKLREYYRRRPFEASPARLKQLFGYSLSCLRTDRDNILPALLREVELSEPIHPARAIYLLELTIEHLHQTTMLEVAKVATVADPLIEKLIRLYLKTFHLDQHAVALVAKFFRDPIFENVPVAHFENYFVVCDYDHSFGDRRVSILGADVSHLDKDTAAKVRYFQTERSKPNSITKMLASFRGRETWFLANLMEAEPIANSVEFLFEEFLEMVCDFDFNSQVIRDLALVGANIQSIEEVAQLPIKKVERAIGPKKNKRLLSAAVSGAISGAGGPVTLGLTTVIDTPVLLYLAAETCARFCWYYGFDPRENEDILAMILGVTLQGSNIQSVKFAHVRADLRRLLVRRSVVLGALSNGAAFQLIAPTLGALLLPRKKNHPHKFAEFGLPSLCALSTMAVNVSFIYDLSEAARWVLTDRFLARKYPQQWESRF